MLSLLPLPCPRLGVCWPHAHGGGVPSAACQSHLCSGWSQGFCCKAAPCGPVFTRPHSPASTSSTGAREPAAAGPHPLGPGLTCWAGGGQGSRIWTLSGPDDSAAVSPQQDCALSAPTLSLGRGQSALPPDPQHHTAVSAKAHPQRGSTFRSAAMRLMFLWRQTTSPMKAGTTPSLSLNSQPLAWARQCDSSEWMEC